MERDRWGPLHPNIRRGEKPDVLEPRYDILRVRGTSYIPIRGRRQAGEPAARARAWIAAPLPKELRSLGFPATIIPRGKLYRSTPTPSANVKCVVDVGWMFALPWTWQYPLVIENPLRFPYDIPLCDT